MQTDNATNSSHRCKHARVRRNWLSEASEGVGRAQTVMLDKLELSETFRNCFTRYRKSCGVKLRVYCLEVLISVMMSKETRFNERKHGLPKASIWCKIQSRISDLPYLKRG